MPRKVVPGGANMRKGGTAEKRLLTPARIERKTEKVSLPQNRLQGRTAGRSLWGGKAKRSKSALPLTYGPCMGEKKKAKK